MRYDDRHYSGKTLFRVSHLKRKLKDEKAIASLKERAEKSR